MDPEGVTRIDMALVNDNGRADMSETENKARVDAGSGRMVGMNAVISNTGKSEKCRSVSQIQEMQRDSGTWSGPKLGLGYMAGQGNSGGKRLRNVDGSGTRGPQRRLLRFSSYRRIPPLPSYYHSLTPPSSPPAPPHPPHRRYNQQIFLYCCLRLPEFENLDLKRCRLIKVWLRQT